MIPRTGSRLGLLTALALLPAACAPETAGMAMPAPASTLSGPGNPGQAPATRSAGGMAGMNHSGMAGMDHSGMAGMDMNAMMTHCAQMRQDRRAGQTVSPDMRQMAAECDRMERSMGTATPPRR